MTNKLNDAIACLRKDGPQEGWTASTVADGHPYPSALAGHMATILNAVVSGELITREAADVRACALLIEAERTCRRAARVTDSPEVQELVWGDTTTGWTADRLAPPYQISKRSSSPELWSWGLNGEGWAGSCGSLEAAKAAAQADYAARILAALKPLGGDA